MLFRRRLSVWLVRRQTLSQRCGEEAEGSLFVPANEKAIDAVRNHGRCCDHGASGSSNRARGQASW
jgi:hypothetical protein